MKKITILLLTFLILATLNSYGVEDYKFRTLSPAGGLDADGVKSICQDKNGFMWFVLSEKLMRFDGFNYKSYSEKIVGYNKENSSIRFQFIYKDSDNDLYLASTVGIFKYDNLLDRFTFFYSIPAISIMEDANRNIWFADREISFYSKEKNTFSTLIPDNKSVINQNNVLCADSSGNVYISADFGKISVVKGVNKEITFLYSFPQNTRIISMRFLENQLWILSATDGLFVLDIASKKMVAKYNFFLNEKDNLVPVRTFYIDRLKNIWVGTQQGLHVFKPTTGKTYKYVRQNENPVSIVNNSIWTINEDTDGNIWIGTYLGGVSFYAPNDKNQFKTFSLAQYGFPQVAISAFAKQNNNIWFGTEGSGLFSYNPNTASLKSFIHQSSKNSLKYNNVKTLLLNNQFLWIGMYRGGLDQLNLKTGVFKNFGANDPNKRIISDEITKLEMERDSGMWIIYQSGGPMLTYFSFKKEISQHYFLNAKENSAENFRIVDVNRGTNSDLWLATANSIFLFDTKQRLTKSFVKIPKKADKSVALNIRAICFDTKRECLWIGTQHYGLIKYNTKGKNSFEYSAELLKYGTSSIQSIIKDESGNLWLGTELGLFRFNPESESFFHYDNNDGIQSSLLYPRSVYSDASGLIYFGGTEGFSYFSSPEIKVNNRKPHLLIADFQVNNQSILSDTALLKETQILVTGGVALSYSENNIGIELSSTNYLMPSKSRYKYRLKGYEDDWIEVDATRRYVSYPKLSAGKYIFEAMAANNDGVWGDVSQLKIVIKPPFWLSTFAYFLYFVIISVIVYWFYRNKIRNDEYKNELYLAECRKKDQEENHQARLRFFTNITHDFKTPLTMILGTLDYVEKEAYNIPVLYIDSLKNNSKRLLALVNEVIDFRTIENGMMKLKLQSVNFNDTVRNCADEMRIYAYQKNINFKITINPIKHNLLIDAQVVEKIILNLIDNAIKYTNDKGIIRIETYNDVFQFKPNYITSHTEGDIDRESKMFGFVVSDTGVGISEESISRVFDRFYRVEDSNELHLGSGIGLALVRSLVLLHGGFITIASEREVGTDFIVGLPYKIGREQIIVNEQRTEDLSIIKEENPAIKELSSLSGSEKKRILCVEDNDEISAMTTNFLKPHFEVINASNGEEALKILDSQHVDLIVSDWMMPIMDGITLCKAVKQLPEKSYIPFILMTVRSGVSSQLEGFDAGAEAYVEKPINFKLLLAAITNLLKLKENTRLHFAETHFMDSHSSGINKDKSETFELLLETIQKHITHGEVNVETIADEMNMSRRKLYNFVKENTDKSIVELIRSYRLRVAAKLLLEENKSVKETMTKVGIESQSYFIKAFKKEFGDSPSAFLSKMRNK